MKDIFQAVSYSQNILANTHTTKLYIQCKTLDVAILSFLQAGLTDSTWLLIFSQCLVSVLESHILHPTLYPPTHTCFNLSYQTHYLIHFLLTNS